MAVYAKDTSVPVDRSKAEIESLLVRYGADQFVSGWSMDEAVIGFRANNKHVRFNLPLPKRDDPSFATTPKRRQYRSPEERLKAWEQECRARWRALALVIKAKLEAVQTGITTFEDEFLAHLVLPSGKTAGEWLGPQLTEVYETGMMPKMLPGLSRTLQLTGPEDADDAEIVQ